MAMLINGKWDPDAKGTMAPDGSFVRADLLLEIKFHLKGKVNFQSKQKDIT